MLAVAISFLCFCNLLISNELPPPRQFRVKLMAINPLHQHPAAPRAEGCEGDKEQKPPVPPAVEHIAGHYHEGVLQAQLPLRLGDKAVEDEPIEQKHYRQEDGELDGVEEHNVLCLRRQRYVKFRSLQAHFFNKSFQERRPMHAKAPKRFELRLCGCLGLLVRRPVSFLA